MFRLVANLQHPVLCLVATMLALGGLLAFYSFFFGPFDNPAVASGFAIAIAMLFFGIGWSSRPLLTGSH